MLEVELPIEHGPEALDSYLERGWFRNGYLLALTPIICMQGNVYVTVPVRARLRGHIHGRSNARLLRRNEERFRVEIARPEVDDDRERLYELTSQRFGGFRMALLEDFLDTGPVFDFFDTWEVTVRDGDKLVASSYFDVGENSVASLLGLYDPSYPRESLGIYTMLLEMEYAKARGLSYYYPGYVLQGHDWFDYKLRFGQMQYLTEAGDWRAISRMSRRSRLRERVYRRITALEAALARRGVRFQRRVYPLFWLGEMEVLPELADDYVAAPLLVECLPGAVPGQWLLAEYLPDEDSYLLSWTRISERVAHHIEGVPTAEMVSDTRYLAEPLVRAQRLCETNDLARVVDAVAEYAAV
jgi:arginine-tRNA-protein transferase